MRTFLGREMGDRWFGNIIELDWGELEKSEESEKRGRNL